MRRLVVNKALGPPAASCATTSTSTSSSSSFYVSVNQQRVHVELGNVQQIFQLNCKKT